MAVGNVWALNTTPPMPASVARRATLIWSQPVSISGSGKACTCMSIAPQSSSSTSRSVMVMIRSPISRIVE